MSTRCWAACCCPIDLVAAKHHPAEQSDHHRDSHGRKAVDEGVIAREQGDSAFEAGLAHFERPFALADEMTVAEEVDVGCIASERHIRRQIDARPEQAAAYERDAVVM